MAVQAVSAGLEWPTWTPGLLFIPYHTWQTSASYWRVTQRSDKHFPLYTEPREILCLNYVPHAHTAYTNTHTNTMSMVGRQTLSLSASRSYLFQNKCLIFKRVYSTLQTENHVLKKSLKNSLQKNANAPFSAHKTAQEKPGKKTITFDLKKSWKPVPDTLSDAPRGGFGCHP